ncbi:hypothetical protein [Paenibacillus sp. FSL R5-0912]|uniref:hypothetical protein n=1 Tax=Paenibacillus sp. FSL R5-0912 TaxID=1536771 RepID=UPI0030ED580F
MSQAANISWNNSPTASAVRAAARNVGSGQRVDRVRGQRHYETGTMATAMPMATPSFGSRPT